MDCSFPYYLCDYFYYAALKNTLIENDMLEDGEIVPNEEVSEKDETTITMTVSYLNQLDYTQDISWLPDSISQPDEFEETFGFEEEYEVTNYEDNDFESVYMDWDTAQAFDIQEYDQMVYLDINMQYPEEDENQPVPLKMNGTNYNLQKEITNDKINIHLEKDDQQLITFDVAEAFSEILDSENTDALIKEYAKGTEDYEDVKLMLVATSITYDGSGYTGEVYLFVEIK